MRASVTAIACAACLAVGCTRSRGPADTIEGAGGVPIVISPIGHGTVEVSSGTDAVLVDPAGGMDYDGLAPPTAIIVTHVHEDHLNTKVIAARRLPKTDVIVSRGIGNIVPGGIVLPNGGRRIVGGMTIEAVPMYNPVGEKYHVKGEGNGYVVTLAGKRFYFAGDTGCIDEMKALKDIDVAFLPMNMPFTMEPSTAAVCAKTFMPKVVYPYHFSGARLDDFVTAMNGSGVDVRLRRWY